MMYLRTGTPGSGKTLSTIDEVDKLAKKEGRDVYYTNIKDLKLEGWYELENADTWHEEIPNGAIYVCDEFYEVFPKLHSTAKRPEHYTLLAKHRHKGLDVYLICQGTQQIDDFLKPLFQNHHHLIRSEMLEQAKVFMSKGFISSPHLKSSRKDLETKIYKFNKDLYGKYFSAEKHTFQKRIPKFYKYFVALLIFLGLSLYFVMNFFAEKSGLKHKDDKDNTNQQSVISASTLNPVFSSSGSRDFNPIIAYKPRIPNMPETAPAYDELRRAKVVPKPTCLMTADKCLCYTQQATLMVGYPDKICRHAVINGIFDPTLETHKAERLSAREDSPARKRRSAPVGLVSLD